MTDMTIETDDFHQNPFCQSSFNQSESQGEFRLYRLHGYEVILPYWLCLKNMQEAQAKNIKSVLKH